MWLFSPEFPHSEPQDEKIKNRSCRNQAAVSQVCRDRFQREGIDAGREPMKWNALAGQSSSLCRALSVIGDRWTLLILNQCFLKLRRYGEIQSSLGLSKPLLAARLKKNGPSWGAEESAFAGVGRVHEYLLTEKGRQLYPVLLALVRWGNALLIEEARPSIRGPRSMRQAALMNAPLPLRHMYSLLRFPRLTLLHLPQHHARVEATDAEAV